MSVHPKAKLGRSFQSHGTLFLSSRERWDGMASKTGTRMKSEEQAQVVPSTVLVLVQVHPSPSSLHSHRILLRYPACSCPPDKSLWRLVRVSCQCHAWPVLVGFCCPGTRKKEHIPPIGDSPIGINEKSPLSKTSGFIEMLGQLL